MKNFIKDGVNITLTAPYARTSGQGMLVGAMFGVCTGDVANGAVVEAVTWGVFDLTKAAGQAWTQGQALYWDDAAKNVTNVAAGNTKIGVAVQTQLATDVIGRVRLNGSF